MAPACARRAENPHARRYGSPSRALVDEIRVRLGQRHVAAKVWIAFQEGSERRRRMHPAEGLGGRNAKGAARLVLKRARRLLGRLGLGENAGAVAIVGSAGLGQ